MKPCTFIKIDFLLSVHRAAGQNLLCRLRFLEGAYRRKYSSLFILSESSAVPSFIRCGEGCSNRFRQSSSQTLNRGLPASILSQIPPHFHPSMPLAYRWICLTVYFPSSSRAFECSRGSSRRLRPRMYDDVAARDGMGSMVEVVRRRVFGPNVAV